ncbi:tryptophan synthase beta subunit-like PLP-dependent enzyme [Xylariaceae sp. AK1471]|nr:tryptophan synthase beta subunit-like PLP-dependent enzyme [Xylariaceae sp. AK1471]
MSDEIPLIQDSQAYSIFIAPIISKQTPYHHTSRRTSQIHCHAYTKMVRIPEPFASFERAPLLFDQPSPLHALPRLTKQVHNTTSARAQLWVKREDCASGLGLGGNKIRKPEYVVPSALAEGCDTLVTTGGVQSNHMRQVAAVANHLGLKAVLVPQAHGEASSDAFGFAGNVQVNKILGAEYTNSGESPEEVVERIRKEGGRPYFIGGGASSHLHGGLGFARWAFEVAEQEIALGVFFDVIVVPVASGGTLGGMIAGFKLVDRLTEASSPISTKAGDRRVRAIIGIDTYNKPAGVLEATILEIAQRTARLIGLEQDTIQAGDVILDTRYNAGTHTDWDQHTARGVKLLGREEGIVSDPIYSGRAIGAILDMMQSGEMDEKQHVLFVHTGGQAALGAFPRLT